MNRLPYIGQKYDVFIASIVTTSYSQSEIVLGTRKTLSQDIYGFKDGTYVIQISNGQLAHFGATYL